MGTVLTVADVAQYLQLSEKTVLKMVREGEIPCAKIGNQWHFLKQMIDDWLIARMNVVPRNDLSRMITTDSDLVPLSRLCDPDLIIKDIRGDDREEILTQLIKPAAATGYIKNEKTFLKGLQEREDMVSTALGMGVAVPHLRKPDPSLVEGPRICIGFAPSGVDYGSPDNLPTYLFFLILSDSEVVHLRILSRIASLVKRQNLTHIIKKMSPSEIYGYLIEQENLLEQPVSV